METLQSAVTMHVVLLEGIADPFYRLYTYNYTEVAKGDYEVRYLEEILADHPYVKRIVFKSNGLNHIERLIEDTQEFCKEHNLEYLNTTG